MRPLFTILIPLAVCGLASTTLENARDRQDKPALEKAVNELRAIAEKQPKDAQAHYRLALAESFLAEIAVEQRDKQLAHTAAEEGIQSAEKAVALDDKSAEYHRLLGTLCGQVISGNGLAALKYGKCALSEVNRAIELDGKSALNYVSHGVGNYYLPPAFGGGVELAIKDFEKAIQMDPKLPEAHLWLGIALRKANRTAEAHKELVRAVELNPNRVWAKQQLDKTPGK